MYLPKFLLKWVLGGAAIMGLSCAIAAPPSAPPVDLVVDDATGDTNELLVRLDYGTRGYFGAYAGRIAQANSDGETERAFVEAVSAESVELKAVLGGPRHARYALERDRLTDQDRERAKKQLPSKEYPQYNARERLEQYMVLRYDTVEHARKAMRSLAKQPGVASVSMNAAVGTVSAAPTDPYFSNNRVPMQYQWGMQAMNLHTAWDVTPGNAYIGILDADWPGQFVAASNWYGRPTPERFDLHPDLAGNFRRHMVTMPMDTTANSGAYVNHTVHVAGIIAATQNNNNPAIAGNGPFGAASNGWVAGGCPGCSFVTYPYLLPGIVPTDQVIGRQITRAVDAGMQVINWSGGAVGRNCRYGDPKYAPFICDAINYATQRWVLIVLASGNSNLSTQQFPANMNNGTTEGPYSILPVGALTSALTPWKSPFSGYAGYCNSETNCEMGSNDVGLYGVMAPGEFIVSTFTRDGTLGGGYVSPSFCSDNEVMASTNSGAVTSDRSSGRYANGIGDGVGSCSGTSMAAPHVTALAGLMRSINPTAPATEIRRWIRLSSGYQGVNPTQATGSGMPNAATALSYAFQAKPDRLTPLYSYYSPHRKDSFYTTVPQMAVAAVNGYLRPRVGEDYYYFNQYTPTYGYLIPNYWLPPGSPFVIGPSPPNWVQAEVWVFTTPFNPKTSAKDLEPLYRMSWKCGDALAAPRNNAGAAPTTLCTSNDQYGGMYHVDTFLVNKSEVNYFKSLNYKVDGVEGYVYPKTQPKPVGTQRLMRKYNPALDDTAVFPESALGTMTAKGYTLNTNGTDWIGYAYPNPANGVKPAIQ
ncbi:S8 family serine peptidase [Ottowia sp.]|uniref:S8 family peptidase n=1 Tax=Ottowia sp. TaxID=1898956 RepID=UPI0025DA69CF|nr:S8 family serine peptidase [Ottowia sp.]MBK6616182.1 S8 family serine peptidase [Ottowia sp.]